MQTAAAPTRRLIWPWVSLGSSLRTFIEANCSGYDKAKKLSVREAVILYLQSCRGSCRVVPEVNDSDIEVDDGFFALSYPDDGFFAFSCSGCDKTKKLSVCGRRSWLRRILTEGRAGVDFSHPAEYSTNRLNAQTKCIVGALNHIVVVDIPHPRQITDPADDSIYHCAASQCFRRYSLEASPAGGPGGPALPPAPTSNTSAAAAAAANRTVSPPSFSAAAAGPRPAAVVRRLSLLAATAAVVAATLALALLAAWAHRLGGGVGNGGSPGSGRPAGRKAT
jgi:hypothetical protein